MTTIIANTNASSATGATASLATATKWVIDPSHSAVEFSVKHLMIATVRGRFSRFQVSVEVDESRLEAAKISATIEASSIATGVDARDEHLRSSDFLHAEAHPTLAFESSRIESLGDGRYRVHGALTIRGVTKDVALDVAHEGSAIDPWTGLHHILTAETQLNRKEFGLVWNQGLETGGVLVGDVVKVAISLQLVKAPA